MQSGPAQRYSQYVRGVRTYVDRIRGGRAEAGQRIRPRLANGRAEYIPSNDPSFNPSVFRERWEEMPRRERQ